MVRKGRFAWDEGDERNVVEYEPPEDWPLSDDDFDATEPDEYEDEELETDRMKPLVPPVLPTPSRLRRGATGCPSTSDGGLAPRSSTAQSDNSRKQCLPPKSDEALPAADASGDESHPQDLRPAAARPSARKCGRHLAGADWLNDACPRRTSL